MTQIIQIKRGTGSAVPSTLADGELAINLDNGQLYYGSGSEVLNNFTATNLTATKLTATRITTTEFTSSFITASIIKTEGSNIFGDAISDTHTFNGNITASGNISSSGNIYADKYYSNGQIAILDINSAITVGYDNTYPINIGKSANPITLLGQVTASGNISSSGNVLADRVFLQNNDVLRYSSANLGLYVNGGIQTIGNSTFGNGDTDIHKFNGAITASGNISASGTITAVSMSGDGSNLTGVSATLPANIVSSSAQIAIPISGSFTAPSASFSTRVTALKTDSGSFSTRVTANDAKVTNSDQDLSGLALKTHVSGSFTVPSSSFSTRVTTLEGTTTSTPNGTYSSSLQILGNITSSGNISASGTITANSLVGTLATAAQTNITSIGTLSSLTISDDIIHGGDTDTKISFPTTDQMTLTAGGTDFIKLIEGSSDYMEFGAPISTPITASDNISSSAYIYADRFYSNGNIALSNDGTSIVLGNANTYPIRIGKSTNPISLLGNVTASGNISASGTITTDKFKANLEAGVDNSVLIKDADGFIKTDEIDSRVWGTTLTDLANGSNNRVITSTDANSLNGEANLIFDGSTLTTRGATAQVRVESTDTSVAADQNFAKIVFSDADGAYDDNAEIRAVATEDHEDSTPAVGSKLEFRASKKQDGGGSTLMLSLDPDDGATFSTQTVKITAGTDGEANLILEADTDNNDENDNPFMSFKQDGGAIAGVIGLSGDADKWPDGTTLTGVTGNAMVIGMTGSASSTNRQLYLAAGNTASLEIKNDADVHIMNGDLHLDNANALFGGTHLLIKFDNEIVIGAGNRGIELNSTTTEVNGLTTFTSAITASGNISSSGTITANSFIETSRTRIKILGRDFVADDGGRPTMIEDDNLASGNEAYLMSHASLGMYAFVNIPIGYTATHMKISGSDTGQTYKPYEGNIGNKSVVSKGAATAINTELNMTDVAATDENYLFIHVTSDGADDEIFGGYVTITPS